MIWCGVVQYNNDDEMIWYNVVWFSIIMMMRLYDMIWYGMIWCDLIWYDMIRCKMIWFDMIWCDLIWYGVRWYDMIRHDVVWYDLRLYDMIRCKMICGERRQLIAKLRICFWQINTCNILQTITEDYKQHNKMGWEIYKKILIFWRKMITVRS